ncbi:MAG: RNA-binding protein [Alphaproteobacteria bacterium]|nr:RNA-binding protein [Alphaproteobacteria bacterium]
MLKRFGTITNCKIGGWPSAIVRFSSHDSAVDAKRAAPALPSIQCF